MKWAGCKDLRAVRKWLGKSQSELAAMLGISLRAVQSYEQGWRRVPTAVQKLAAVFCHLAWRKEHGKPAQCWDVRGCDKATRERCIVYQLDAGDFCWLVGGHASGGGRALDARRAVGRDCARCPVTRCWLPAAQ